jgi:hypothetical protein
VTTSKPPSLRMGGCVPRASITQGSRECYMTHSSTSATMGMFRSTVLTCPWLGMDQCEVSVTIPLNPVEPWMATIIGVEQDDTIEQTALVALSSLCGSRLVDTTVIPIVLFEVHYRGDPVWQQCLQAISDSEGPHFQASMGTMAEYAQYSFDLQHTTTRTVI